LLASLSPEDHSLWGSQMQGDKNIQTALWKTSMLKNSGL
jgi:hypothetical protein